MNWILLLCLLVLASLVLGSLVQTLGRDITHDCLPILKEYSSFADGDQPGTEFARSLARELPVTIVQFPDGEDVNSVYVSEGINYFNHKVGISD